MKEQTKKTKRRILIAIIGLIVIIILFVFFIFNEPRIFKGRYLEKPITDVYGNSSANLSSGGKVCALNDDVLLSVNGKIKLLSTDDMEINEFIDLEGSYINCINSEIYFLNEYDFFEYNDDEKKVKRYNKYANYTLQAVGEKLFTFSDEYIPVFNCFDLVENSSYHIRGTTYPSDGEYYMGELYYIEKSYENNDNYYFCKLDNNGKVTGLFDVLSSIKYFIDENVVYYSYYNAENNPEILGVWTYDLETNVNSKLFDSSEDILIENIADNKIMYQYFSMEKSGYWAIYDIEDGTVSEIIETGYDVINIYTANNLIFVYLKVDDEYSYKIYDTDGNNLNVQVN